ncbi:recombinase family protein [Rhodococcus sp. D2-41]|uniref:recombinase family protein n=1 Tax=Speluncibacter jeojiensis TaxID=2710754 RepID=UPI00240FA828|nr:recombinase family protein [Rhodococcus sp. D2-41]MDG3012496.1 recombinase family protein [Rhodococcus sp. D2-41]
MKAIIYCRVSSDPTGRGRSVAEQEAECRQVCAREGWQVSEVLTDNDIGASRHSGKARPAYERLADALQAGDILVTWEASRAQRDLAAYVALRELCAERGVLWSYSGNTFDLRRGEDRFRTGLDALLAENEAEKIRERVLRALRADAAAGKPHGKIPYGYRAVRDITTGRIVERVPHENQAAVVREVAHRLLAGDSIWSVARDLTARGVPTATGGETWRPQQVKDMIRRPTYAGLRSHHGELTQGQWEPLITRDDHMRLCTLLDAPGRKTHRGVEPKHLLTGIATCDECGKYVWRMKSNGGGSYVCEDRCVSRKMEPVDMLVTEVILRRCESLSAPDELEATGPADALIEARTLRARLDGFVDQAADGSLSPAALARIEAKLLPQILAAERRAQSTVSPLVLELLGPTARGRWDGMSIVTRREVVRSLATVRICRQPRGKVFRPEFVRIDWL